MRETNKIKKHIQLLVTFFNEKITKYFFREEFQKQAFQDLINEKPQEIKFFLKESYIKTYNLSRSIIMLSIEQGGYILPDEAQIIFRSLFEHISNFIYIFMQENEENTINLINRFNDYSFIIQFKHLYNYRNSWARSEIIKNKITRKINIEVNKMADKYNIANLYNDYRKKYKNSVMSSWHGLKTKDFYNEIFNKTPFGSEFSFFQMYYTKANAYVHCNFMDYTDENGVFVGNYRYDESLELIQKTIFMLISYYEIFYKILDINFRMKYEKIFNEFFNLYNISVKKIH